MSDESESTVLVKTIHYLICVILPEQLCEQVLSPHDAVYGRRGGVSDGAAWKRFLSRFRQTLVALRPSSDDDSDLSQIPLRPALDQRNLRRETHPGREGSVFTNEQKCIKDFNPFSQ